MLYAEFGLFNGSAFDRENYILRGSPANINGSLPVNNPLATGTTYGSAGNGTPFRFRLLDRYIFGM